MRPETEAFLTQQGLWNNIPNVNLSRISLAQLLEKYAEANKLMNEREKLKTILKPSFWFMTCRHTFIRPKGSNIQEIKDDFIKIAKENPYGMVCPVTILQNDREIASIGENCHVDENGYVDLEKWFLDIQKEDCIKHYKK